MNFGKDPLAGPSPKLIGRAPVAENDTKNEVQEDPFELCSGTKTEFRQENTGPAGLNLEDCTPFSSVWMSNVTIRLAKSAPEMYNIADD